MVESIIKGKYVFVQGLNIATATALETICARSAIITPRPAPAAAQVSSGSAADVNTSGTGAWKVKLYGLDASYKEVEEELALNGQTAVTGTQIFFRINQMVVVGAGTGLANAGEVVASVSGAALTAGIPTTAADVMSSMLVGSNHSQQALYTVPAEKSISLTHVGITNRSQIDRVYLNVKPYMSKLWYTIMQFELSATNSHQEDFPKGALIFPQFTDIRFDCIAGTAGGFVGLNAVFEVV